MAITLRKIASFFRPQPRKPQRARRSRSSTPDSLSSDLSSSAASSRSSHGGSTTISRDSSVRGSSRILIRLKSWFERTKSVVPEGFFSMDVGKQKKIRYVVPITYLSHEDLQKLLDDSVAEFGHSYVGALQVSCEEDEFQEVLETIEKSFEGGDDTEGERRKLIAGKDDHEKLH